MSKLNQIIAVEKGVKSRSYAEVSALYKTIQKPDLFHGFDKKYQKKDEADEALPGETKRIQYKVGEVIRSVERSLGELLDITARKDWTNCNAKADVKVDGKVLLKAVPVSYLLFLEKQLTDLRTFITTLPVLDSAENWKYDQTADVFKTDIVSTSRTKKVSKPLVLYPATDKHPAQTQIIQEDIIAGFWNMEKHSGAIPKPQKDSLIERVEVLLKSVKEAREEANGVEEVATPKVADEIFNFLFK